MSAAAIAVGYERPGRIARGIEGVRVKPPRPSLVRIETLPPSCSATARSTSPSPSRSAAASATGPAPVLTHCWPAGQQECDAGDVDAGQGGIDR